MPLYLRQNNGAGYQDNRHFHRHKFQDGQKEIYFQADRREYQNRQALFQKIEINMI